MENNRARSVEDPYTIREAAERLKLSERTVWRMIDRGQLDAISIGTRRRVTAASLHRVLREGTGEAG